MLSLRGGWERSYSTNRKKTSIPSPLHVNQIYRASLSFDFLGNVFIGKFHPYRLIKETIHAKPSLLTTKENQKRRWRRRRTSSLTKHRNSQSPDLIRHLNLSLLRHPSPYPQPPQLPYWVVTRLDQSSCFCPLNGKCEDRSHPSDGLHDWSAP